MGERTNPPFSRVEQRAQELGYRAAALLNRMMAVSRSTLEAWFQTINWQDDP